MELKSNPKEYEHLAAQRYNWTLLELKLKNTRLGYVHIRSVIIEPYWNWNINKNGGVLKFECYNWTLLELKFHKALLWRICLKCYNWTLLELKLQKKSCTAVLHLVIIEPYWNWNTNSVIAFQYKQKEAQRIAIDWNTNSVIAFQNEEIVIIEPYWNWNEYHGALTKEGLLVIIEPYWNWNWLLGVYQASVDSRYNWTLLELKCNIFRYIGVSVSSYNWTLLELKSHHLRSALWHSLL